MATIVMATIYLANENLHYRCSHDHHLLAWLWLTLWGVIAFDLNLQRNLLTILWRMSLTRNVCLCSKQSLKASFGNMHTWWLHQMETFSTLLAFVRWIHRSPVICPLEGQWHRASMFSLISAWTSGWASNRHAGDLRRHQLNVRIK